jgi:hypothetical protein
MAFFATCGFGDDLNSLGNMTLEEANFFTMLDEYARTRHRCFLAEMDLNADKHFTPRVFVRPEQTRTQRTDTMSVCARRSRRGWNRRTIAALAPASLRMCMSSSSAAALIGGTMRSVQPHVRSHCRLWTPNLAQVSAVEFHRVDFTAPIARKPAGYWLGCSIPHTLWSMNHARSFWLRSTYQYSREGTIRAIIAATPTHTTAGHSTSAICDNRSQPVGVLDQRSAVTQQTRRCYTDVVRRDRLT